MAMKETKVPDEVVASWTPTEENPYMRVGNLRALLATLPDDLLIVLSKDGEGNSFSPLSDTGDPASTVYEPESTWAGLIVDTDEMEEDEMAPDAVPCLVLWPVN
jgi:hypothetical protein